MLMTSCGNARGNIQQSRARILADMITTLRTNFRDPVRRKMFGARLGGKFIGVGIVVALIYAFAYLLSSEAASAMPLHSQAVSVKAQLQGTINGLNTAWVLITAFLVFFMQAGFMMLEGGFARTREVSNIMIECIVDTALCGILFFAFGFAFMFGRGNGWIGYQYFFLQDVPHTYDYGGLLNTGVAFPAFFLFQFAFADTASTIVSGAMVGRTSFKGDLLYSVAVSGFIYPIFGHWVWGPNGWLATSSVPFRDFAGSTVVHTIGGTIALVGAIALGPRIGRVFKRDGGGMPAAHDLTIASLGGVILWFGWYGFNLGSTLSALDAGGIGRVATNTTLAAAAGGLAAMFFLYPRVKKWDMGITINGFLGGLVAITCPCYWVNQLGTIIIGTIAGVIVVLGIDLVEHFRVDDPIGAVAVHGCCGIWGTWSLGLFATGQFGTAKGLLWGAGEGSVKLFVAQVGGNLIMAACAFAAAMVLMLAVRATKTLRVS